MCGGQVDDLKDPGEVEKIADAVLSSLPSAVNEGYGMRSEGGARILSSVPPNRGPKCK